MISAKCNIYDSSKTSHKPQLFNSQNETLCMYVSLLIRIPLMNIPPVLCLYTSIPKELGQ